MLHVLSCYEAVHTTSQEGLQTDRREERVDNQGQMEGGEGGEDCLQ